MYVNPPKFGGETTTFEVFVFENSTYFTKV